MSDGDTDGRAEQGSPNAGSKTEPAATAHGVLSSTRRQAMALLGLGGLGLTATQSAAGTSAGPPFYDWREDVVANGYALSELGSLSMDHNDAPIRDFAGENLTIDDGTLHADVPTGVWTDRSGDGLLETPRHDGISVSSVRSESVEISSQPTSDAEAVRRDYADSVFEPQGATDVTADRSAGVTLRNQGAKPIHVSVTVGDDGPVGECRAELLVGEDPGSLRQWDLQRIDFGSERVNEVSLTVSGTVPAGWHYRVDANTGGATLQRWREQDLAGDLHRSARLDLTGVGSHADSGDGRDVWIDGDYAYVGGGYSGGLFVWDVSNPAAPELVGQVHDGLDFGRGVQVAGDVAYLACRDSNEFATIDVSNPESPVILDRYQTEDGGDLDGARGIDVQPELGCAFVALGHFKSGGDPSLGEGLTVMDVSDPTDLRLAENLDGDDGDVYASGDAHYHDGYVYTSGYQDGVLMVFDASDPLNTEWAATWDPGFGDARGISSRRRDDVLFLNSPADDAVVAVDVSDPLQLSEIGRISDGRLAGARANSLDGDDLFVSCRSSNRIAWIDVGDPTDMRITDTLQNDSLTGAYGSFTDGEHAYAAAAGAGDLTAARPVTRQ